MSSQRGSQAAPKTFSRVSSETIGKYSKSIQRSSSNLRCSLNGKLAKAPENLRPPPVAAGYTPHRFFNKHRGLSRRLCSRMLAQRMAEVGAAA